MSVCKVQWGSRKQNICGWFGRLAFFGSVGSNYHFTGRTIIIMHLYIITNRTVAVQHSVPAVCYYNYYRRPWFLILKKNIPRVYHPYYVLAPVLCYFAASVIPAYYFVWKSVNWSKFKFKVIITKQLIVLYNNNISQSATRRIYIYIYSTQPSTSYNNNDETILIWKGAGRY